MRCLNYGMHESNGIQTVCHDAWHKPATLPQALGLIEQYQGNIAFLAGGTDVFPSMVGGPATQACGKRFLDITHIPEVAILAIEPSPTGTVWRIGASVTWAQFLEHTQVAADPLLHALRQASLEIGGVQIQASGTLVGNVCNASPAADGMPCLLALEASVELRSRLGTRVLPLAQFVLGPRRCALQPGEMVTALLVPCATTGAKVGSAFLKLGARKYLLISIAMVAALVEQQQGIVTKARVAVGSCSAVAQRLFVLEQRLEGLRLEEAQVLLAAGLSQQDLSGLTPIDDVRASGAYRLHAAGVLAKRALLAALAV
jgi:CO/xanthine dehydrogenase FAD-binding subunit